MFLYYLETFLKTGLKTYGTHSVCIMMERQLVYLSLQHGATTIDSAER